MVEKISKLTLVDWQGTPPDDNIVLPAPNKYIPGIIPGSELKPSPVDPAAPVFPALPQPHLIVNDTFGKLYHRQDTSFGDPWFEASFRVRTHKRFLDEMGAKALVLTALFVSCVVEHIKTPSYPYVTSGLSAGFNIGAGTDLWISISGLNPVERNWEAFLSMLLDAIASKKLSEFASRERFGVILDAMQRSYHNELKAGPSSQAGRKLWGIMSKTKPDLKELITAAQLVTYEELEAYIPKLLAKVSCLGFFYGQVKADAAKRAWALMKRRLMPPSTRALHHDEIFHGMVRVLPTRDAQFPTTSALPMKKGHKEGRGAAKEESAPYAVAVKGAARGNATVLLMDFGSLDCRETTAMQILYRALPNMFFKELRTKQQTGYVASASMTSVERRTMGLFAVESSWCGPADLLRRFEAFILQAIAGLQDGVPEKKATLTAESFETIRHAILASFKKPIPNIAGMGQTMQGVVMDYDSDFNAMLKRRTILQTLTLSEVKAVARRVLSLANLRRLAVLYVPFGAKHDLQALPAAYSLRTPEDFAKPNHGHFVRRPKYQCNVPITANPALEAAAKLKHFEKEEEEDEAKDDEEEIVLDNDLDGKVRVGTLDSF